METLHKMMKFNEFLLEKSGSARDTAIATAVAKLKKKYGDSFDEFLKSLKEKEGFVEEAKDYIVKILEPYLAEIKEQEKNTNGQLKFDFDGLLEGLVSWCLVELELKIIRKQSPKNR